MKCPVDGVELLMAERQGVEIDYCPKCRGVWLDRGELDKIIEKATPAIELEDPDPYWGAPDLPPPPPMPEPRAAREPEPRYEERREGRYDERRKDDRYDDRDNKYEKRGKYDRWEKDGRDKYEGRGKPYRKKKRKSVLKEIFDIFD